MAYERELEVALEAAREAGTILRRHYAGDRKSWEKSKDNPLTLADLESDKAIAACIRAAFPDDAILSEETVSDPSRIRQSRVWIMDPMDGTKEFTQKIPRARVLTVASVMGPQGGAAGEAAGEAVLANVLVHEVAERVLGAIGPVPVADAEGRVVGSLDRDAVTRVLLDKDQAG